MSFSHFVCDSVYSLLTVLTPDIESTTPNGTLSWDVHSSETCKTVVGLVSWLRYTLPEHFNINENWRILTSVLV